MKVFPLHIIYVYNDKKLSNIKMLVNIPSMNRVIFKQLY